jgi:RimJ/RimL family protein N-acetyltransferase
MMQGMASTAWPLFELRVTTPQLTLRLPTDAELMRLADRAAGRVLPPEQAIFMTEWTQLPSPRFERNLMQFHWRLRADWTPARWWLALGIYPTGEEDAVGGIDATTEQFARTRAATSGWWLLQEWRGRGLGREALAALAHLLFDGLDAHEVRAIVHPDNAASLGAARAAGFIHDGTERSIGGDGVAYDAVRVLLRRDGWTQRRRADIAIAGLDGCRELFGVRSRAGSDRRPF